MSLEARQATLKQIIEYHGPIIDLWLPSNISGTQLLGAIAENESTFGLHRFSKHEVSWDQGGKYFQKNLWDKWGSDASCSRSSFQVMYPVCVMEYGLSSDVAPQLLDDDHVAVMYVCKYIKRKFDGGANTLNLIFDAYNSGSHRDTVTEKVANYIAKGLKNYQEVRARRGLVGGRILT